jgi:hypothetical protein
LRSWARRHAWAPQPTKATHDQQPLAEGTLFKNPDGSVVFVPQDDERCGFYGFPGAPGSQPAAELNAIYGRAHRSGASGQTRAADDRLDTTAYAQQARAGVAPLNTPYTTGRGSEGGRTATPQGANGRGAPGREVFATDPAQGFANELQKIPHGQPQRAINAYRAAYHRARTPAARDVIDEVWSAFQRR